MDAAHRAHRERQRMWLAITAVALLLALLSLIAGTVRFAQHAAYANQESERQVDLNGRIRQMQEILHAVGDAETGQRGYLLTGRPAYLQPYRHATDRLPALMKSLDDVPIHSASFQERAASVRHAMRLKLDELAETIRLQDAGRRDEALQLMETDGGKRYMDFLRSELDETMREIRENRDASTAQLLAVNESMRRWAIWTVAALLVCIGLAAVQIALLASTQRRYARHLAESEMRHRALVEEQHELISLSTPEGVISYANPAFRQCFGGDAVELVGRNLYDFVDPADRPMVRQQIDAALSSGLPQQAENRVSLPGGQTKWIAWTNSPQRDHAGRPRLHSVGRDVTERRHAEDALRASQAFLARTGRVAGVGGWELDLTGGAMSWSSEMKRIHDVPEDYAPTLEKAIAAYDPEGQAQLRQALRRAVDLGQPFDLELPLRTDAGRQIWVRAVGEFEVDAHGRRRIAGACQDITERKTLEAQLAQSEQFIRQVTDHQPVRIAYVDRGLRYRFVNKAHARRYGLAKEQVLGKTLAELDTNGAALPHVERRLAEALAGQPQRFEHEEIIDGDVRLIDTQLIPDEGPEGQVRGVYLTGVDITASKATERQLRELNQILEHTTDFIVQTDWTGQVQYMNPAARRALAIGLDEDVSRRRFTDFNTPQTTQRYEQEIMPALRQAAVWIGETTVVLAGHRITPVSHMVIAHRDAEGRMSRYSAVMRDISEDVAARAQLRQQTATLGAVVEAIPAMVAVFDAQFRYRLVNRAFERWRGKDRSAIVGRTMAELFGQQEHDISWPWALRALAGETVSYEKDYPHMAQHRHVSVAYVPLRLDDGTVDGAIGVVQDITTHREQERRLINLAERDALTGVLNRAGFNAYLGAKCEPKAATTLGLLYIDLDHFKPVNDTHGHPVGDELLRQFAQRLQSIVRPTDAVARLGGDEFALVLCDVASLANAQAVADKVVEAGRSPFDIGGRRLQVSASVGVAFGAAEPNASQGLIERADAAVYAAKAAGRGRRI
ncbi:MAG TPA: PAS domain-containing protein [Ideonella sp.]|uniref:PAS domain-containing protein n=1 Tax=Ideonella sp. TaxID=1929293 RepID=UPI002E36A704|nr:PAS domain-containing protein [Ideonella sp.]HEX5683461.1 PAS domain-containing protein [Ideonella sp.]